MAILQNFSMPLGIGLGRIKDLDAPSDLSYYVKTKPDHNKSVKLFESVPLINVYRPFNDIILAGGAARALITGEIPHDYDFYFRTDKVIHDARQTLKQGYYELEDDNKFVETYTKKLPDKEYRLQLIVGKTFRNAQDVLDSFDFTVTQFALNENNELLYGMPSLIDAENKQLRLTVQWLEKSHHPRKVARVLGHAFKYISYGYTPIPDTAALLIRKAVGVDSDEVWQAMGGTY